MLDNSFSTLSNENILRSFFIPFTKSPPISFLNSSYCMLSSIIFNLIYLNLCSKNKKIKKIKLSIIYPIYKIKETILTFALFNNQTNIIWNLYNPFHIKCKPILFSYPKHLIKPPFIHPHHELTYMKILTKFLISRPYNLLIFLAFKPPPF